MKKYLPSAASLLLALASLSFGQTEAAKATPPPPPKRAISKAQIQKNLIASEKKLWEAWKNKDPKPFKSALAADCQVIGEDGVEGKDAILKQITGMDCTLKSYELSDFKLTMLSSSMALLTYTGKANGTCGANAIPVVWASSTWANRGGKWVAVAHQETPTK